MPMSTHPSVSGQNVFVHATAVDWDEYFFSHVHSPEVVYRRAPSETIRYNLQEFVELMGTIGEYYHLYHPYPLVIPSNLARFMAVIGYNGVIRTETWCCGEGDLMIVDDQYQSIMDGEDITDQTPSEVGMTCECGRELTSSDVITLGDGSLITKEEMTELWMAKKSRAAYMNWMEHNSYEQ